jgi:hypothetical protein
MDLLLQQAPVDVNALPIVLVDVQKRVNATAEKFPYRARALVDAHVPPIAPADVRKQVNAIVDNLLFGERVLVDVRVLSIVLVDAQKAVNANAESFPHVQGDLAGVRALQIARAGAQKQENAIVGIRQCKKKQALADASARRIVRVDVQKQGHASVAPFLSRRVQLKTLQAVLAAAPFRAIALAVGKIMLTTTVTVDLGEFGWWKPPPFSDLFLRIHGK